MRMAEYKILQLYEVLTIIKSSILTMANNDLVCKISKVNIKSEEYTKPMVYNNKPINCQLLSAHIKTFSLSWFITVRYVCKRNINEFLAVNIKRKKNSKESHSIAENLSNDRDDSPEELDDTKDKTIYIQYISESEIDNAVEDYGVKLISNVELYEVIRRLSLDNSVLSEYTDDRPYIIYCEIK
jgi:hypothetical protein